MRIITEQYDHQTHPVQADVSQKGQVYLWMADSWGSCTAVLWLSVLFINHLFPKYVIILYRHSEY